MNNYLTTDLILFLPELFFITSTVALLLWSLFLTTTPTSHFKTINLKISALLIETSIITIILVSKNLHKKKTIFYNSLLVDNYSAWVKMLILLFTIFFFILLAQYTKQHIITDFEFPILIAFTTFAVLLLIATHDLITFYLSIEMQSLCLYTLAAFKKTSQFSSEAGLKYFVLGAFSSSLLLFGMSLIYGFTGSTNFAEINQILISIADSTGSTTSTLNLGIVFLICGFLFKLTAVPFHIWSPDVYEGSPLIITIFFSTIPKLAIFSIFVKFIFFAFFDLYVVWQPILATSAAATILFGSLAALYQKKIKRFLAYSSISHAGYMLVGLSTGTLTGLHSFFLYIMVYLVTMFTFFGILLSLKKKHNKNLVYITDLLLLTDVHPLTKVVFALALFSLAGIPPLIGFFAKFYIFFAAIEASYHLPAVLGVVSSTLSAFYYIRLIKIINFEKPELQNHLKTQSLTSTINFTLFGFLLLSLFIVAPNFLVAKTYQLALLF